MSAINWALTADPVHIKRVMSHFPTTMLLSSLPSSHKTMRPTLPAAKAATENQSEQERWSWKSPVHQHTLSKPPDLAMLYLQGYYPNFKLNIFCVLYGSVHTLSYIQGSMGQEPKTVSEQEFQAWFFSPPKHQRIPHHKLHHRHCAEQHPVPSPVLFYSSDTLSQPYIFLNLSLLPSFGVWSPSLTFFTSYHLLQQTSGRESLTATSASLRTIVEKLQGLVTSLQPKRVKPRSLSRMWFFYSDLICLKKFLCKFSGGQNSLLFYSLFNLKKKGGESRSFWIHPRF